MLQKFLLKFFEKIKPKEDNYETEELLTNTITMKYHNYSIRINYLLHNQLIY